MLKKKRVRAPQPKRFGLDLIEFARLHGGAAFDELARLAKLEPLHLRRCAVGRKRLSIDAADAICKASAKWGAPFKAREVVSFERILREKPKSDHLKIGIPAAKRWGVISRPDVFDRRNFPEA